MKKILISLLVVVTFLTLTSCGNKNVSEDSSVEIQDENNQVNIQDEYVDDDVIDLDNDSYSIMEENYRLTSSRIEEIKSSFVSKSGFTLNKIEVYGKSIIIFITVSDMSKNDIKSEAMRLINSFSDDEIETYSFQVNVISNGDDYPMVGYKEKNSKNLFWNYDGEN